jgi:hypothetical protein
MLEVEPDELHESMKPRLAGHPRRITRDGLEVIKRVVFLRLMIVSVSGDACSVDPDMIV